MGPTSVEIGPQGENIFDRQNSGATRQHMTWQHSWPWRSTVWPSGWLLIGYQLLYIIRVGIV